jgi:predicted GH43/DUF377 family glycosyl hydrolase
MKRESILRAILLGILIFAILFVLVSNNLIGFARGTQGVTSSAGCENLGWFPSNFGLKDHTVFWYSGDYYITSIYLQGETKFAYSRSTDMCSWEVLAPVLTQRTAGSWDEMAIWSPFVYQEKGVYYLYYTGVTPQYTQSILLATTSDPADPTSWQPQGVVFQPAHAGMVWQKGQWANCRDPDVVKVGNLYFLYYTGSDTHGGILGMATASSPLGPWTDWGAVLSAPPESDAMYESPAIFFYANYFYLAYNDAKLGERYLIGPSPGGPWVGPFILSPGWANELWTGQDGKTYSSYLTDYTIAISPITWELFFSPPHLWIGPDLFHTLLPFLVK